jgi:hypothetical protein
MYPVIDAYVNSIKLKDTRIVLNGNGSGGISGRVGSSGISLFFHVYKYVTICA